MSEEFVPQNILNLCYNVYKNNIVNSRSIFVPLRR